MCDGITDLDLRRSLDTGNDISHIAAADLLCRRQPHFQHTDFVSDIFLSGIEELDLVTGMDNSVLDLEICDNASERVEHRVENQCLKRCFRVSFRCRNLLHDGIQKRRHAFSSPRGNLEHFLRIASEKVADLVGHHVRTRGIHVDLVQDRYNLQTMVNGLIQVRNRLCLNALRSIHHKQRTFTGCDGTGHLIREVHVARGIDEVQHIRFSLIVVLHLNSMALDGDALFPLQVHIVQDLIFHLPRAQRLCKFNEPVGQCALAVVNMGNDAEISNMFHLPSYF